VNTALLVLRLVPGLLLIGHGLQKLVPAKYSPPLLHAVGPRAAAGFFEQLGLRPALLSPSADGAQRVANMVNELVRATAVLEPACCAVRWRTAGGGQSGVVRANGSRPGSE
jgi:uncharacterized membrane protein YphA (DoxX/SURF4 family)